MKKTLSLLLVLAMVLGSFSFAFADEAKVDPAVEAGEFLKKAGVLEGSDSGDLMLDKQLKRQDAVVLLSRLMKAEEEAKKFPVTEEYPTFKDITNNYYKPYLAWAQANKYYEGHNAEKFGYGEFLTAQQYATVLLRALGYEVNDAEAYKAAFETAKKLGIMKDLKVEEKAEITRGQMAQMTFNALGLKMKGSDKTLAEFLGIEMPAPAELKVEKVYTENLAEVVVELSNAKLADRAKLENPANYRLSGTNDPVVKTAKLDGNNVILTLVPAGKVQDMKEADLNKALVKGRKYSLTIRNIARELNSTYKNILAEDNAIPTVESVEFIGDYGIKVVTSEPVKAPQERNFVVDGTRTSMIVEQYGRVIILTPYYDKAFAEDAKKLTVKGLEDFAGYKSVETDYELALSTDKDAPKVVKALRNGNKLTVVFDRDIYEKSVEAYESRRDLGNVSFKERNVTFYAEKAVKVAPNVAVYAFEREIPKNTEVTVEGVQNHFKKAMEREVVNPDLFVDEYAPVIISKLVNNVETLGAEKKGEITNATDSLKITFDKDIQEFVEHQKKDGKQIKVEDFFTVYELNVSNKGKVAAKDVKIVIDEVKDDYIKLSFKNIRVNNKDRDYDYVLEVRDFSDQNRNRMEREYIDFQIVEASDDFKLTDINVVSTGTYETEVKLYFNAPVDKEIASDRTNYFFGEEKAIAASEAIVERDGKTVTLVVGKKIADVRDYGVLEVSPKVIDLDENKIASTAGKSSRFWNLKTLKMINVEPVNATSAITYINDKTPGYVTEVASGDIATTAGVTVKLDADNKLNHKVVAFKGVDQLPAATQEGKATLTVTLDKLGFTSSNIDKEDYKVLVKVYKEETEGKKDYKLVEEKEIYTKDIQASTISLKSLAGKDAVAGAKAKTSTVSALKDLLVETAEKTATYNGKTITVKASSTADSNVEMVVDGANYAIEVGTSKTTVTAVELKNAINAYKESGEQVFVATAEDVSDLTVAGLSSTPLTFDNNGETPVAAEPIVLTLTATKAIKPVTEVSFVLNNKTVNAKVEVSKDGKELKLTEMKYAVSGEAVKKAEFTGQTINEIIGLETVEEGLKVTVNVTGM